VEAAIDRFAELAAARAPLAELARADLEVVSALVAATDSIVLRLCLNPVASLLARLPRLQEAMYGEPEGNVLAFRAVLAWVRAGNAGDIDGIVAALAARDDATVSTLTNLTKTKTKTKTRTR
jgi:hypothetical protein